MRAPPDLGSLKGLIRALRHARRFAEATAAVRQWQAWSPGDPAAEMTLAHIYLEQMLFDEALEAALRAAEMAPGDPDAALLAARSLQMTGRHPEALEQLYKACGLAPERADVRVHLANGLKTAGRFSEAEAELRQALAADPANATACFELSQIHVFSTGDSLIREMEALVGQGASGDASRRLHYALGKAYDDLGDTEVAFAHFELANQLERAVSRYDEKAALAYIDGLTAVFSPEAINGFSGQGIETGLPVFLVGMPRSGSTLAEQVLASHPDVAAAGETPHFRLAVEQSLRVRPLHHEHLNALTARHVKEIGAQYLSRILRHAGGNQRVTDKLPANALLVPLIHAALPEARIIHCVRNPMDTCLSCYMKSFGTRLNYASDLGTLGRYYRRHTAMMERWADILPGGTILTLRYEELVGDFAAAVGRILDFCGLAWDERCLRFHETQRAVHTASAVEVRKPLHNRSIGRWRAYERHLQPLKAALGDLAPS